MGMVDESAGRTSGGRMSRDEALLSYVREQANLMDQNISWVGPERSYDEGSWVADKDSYEPVIHSRVVTGLEILRQYAGEGSHWYKRAADAYGTYSDGRSPAATARQVAEVLRAWVSQVEAGFAEILGARARAEVEAVSTDVMGQVRRLVEDPDAHPAAAIVLCGAALETALRATADARNLSLPERQRPSLSSYSQLLRAADLFTRQDVKDVEQCGGLRNSAAHGHFGDLSRERAGLMEQQTNLLLRKLSDLATAGDEPE
ncbi:hypothetical protein [Streptomyces griseus]|uniref:hypothetical protein n=1 Tax=Streptomyces griseus TaxID=1911 RepID=UPI00369353F6